MVQNSRECLSVNCVFVLWSRVYVILILCTPKQQSDFAGYQKQTCATITRIEISQIRATRTEVKKIRLSSKKRTNRRSTMSRKTDFFLKKKKTRKKLSVHGVEVAQDCRSVDFF